MPQFRISAIAFGSTVIPGVGQLSISEDGAVEKPQTDGSNQPAAAFKLQVQDGITFSTHQVEDMLALLVTTGVVTGKAISTFVGGIIVYLAESDALTAMTGSTHVAVTIAGGVVVPVDVSANQGALAQLNVQIVPSAAGAAAIAVVVNSALPTVPAITEAFTLGRVNLSGAQVAVVTAASINFGFAANRQYANGLANPTAVFVDAEIPEASITTLNADLVNTFKTGAVALSGAGLEMFFTRVAADGLPDAASAEAHVALTIPSGMITRPNSTGSLIVETTIVVHGRTPASGGMVQFAVGQIQN